MVFYLQIFQKKHVVKIINFIEMSLRSSLSERFYITVIRPQLVKSLVIVIRSHVVKVYGNYEPTLIIYEVNRNFSFLPIIYSP